MKRNELLLYAHGWQNHVDKYLTKLDKRRYDILSLDNIQPR